MKRHEVKNMFLSDVKNLQGTILEIGFGKPTFYKKYSTNVKIYAVDFSREVIKSTREHLSKTNNDNRIKVLYSSDEKLPFYENSFDIIVLSFCICCLRKPKQILEEITRVGKNKSKIISFEHVRSDGLIGLFLDISTPLYAFMHKNCHLNRNPLNYFNQANFLIVLEKKSEERFIPWLMTKCEIEK